MGLLITAASTVTDFADEAVVLPGTALIAVMMLFSGWRRGALVWSMAVAGTLAFVLALKIGFGACGHLIMGGEITSPSGHTAAAGVFYGTIAGYVAYHALERRWVSVATVVLIVSVFGASRIVLGAHTPAEVVIGGAVGVFGALTAIAHAGPAPEGRIRLAVFLLPAAVAILLLHGLQLPAEAAIHDLSAAVWPFRACR